MVPVFTTVVGRPLPFHRTTENPSNPLPVTVSVSDGIPACAVAGDTAVTTGCGFDTGASVESASNRLTRGVVTLPPIRASTIGGPVTRSALRTGPPPAAGTACRSRPHEPATCGVAI